MVDYRNLRSVQQIAEEAPALSQGTLEKWRFYRQHLNIEAVFVKIDANVYWDTAKLNVWLYEGKPTTGDFRDLRTLQQIIATCALPESKLRHWLKYRKTNGLDAAVITKTIGRHGKLYIDYRLLNAWLAMQNRNTMIRRTL